MRCQAHNSGTDIPATFIWTAALSGNKIPLCAPCCAAWRAGAVAEPELAARSIRPLRGA